MAQAAQIVGALLILVAFVPAQFRILDQHSYWYLWLNLVGAAALTVLAWHERQWGFFILEAVWTLVTAWSLYGQLRMQPASTASELSQWTSSHALGANGP